MKLEKLSIDGKKDTIEVLDKIFSAKINSKLVSSVLYKTLLTNCLFILAKKILSKTSKDSFFPFKLYLSIFIIFSFYLVFF